MPVSAWSTSGAKYARACKLSKADLNRFSSPAIAAPYYRVTTGGTARGVPGGSGHVPGESAGEPTLWVRDPTAWIRDPTVRVRGLEADEPACKPDPVPGSPRGSPGGGHPSRPAVAGRLQRPTRRLGRAVLERLRRSSRSLLALLRVGFT